MKDILNRHGIQYQSLTTVGEVESAWKRQVALAKAVISLIAHLTQNSGAFLSSDPADTDLDLLEAEKLTVLRRIAD